MSHRRVKTQARQPRQKGHTFNRAVSLKNFILRKGKSTSMDMGEGTAAQKEGDGTVGMRLKMWMALIEAAGATDVRTDCNQRSRLWLEWSNNEALVAGEHKSSDGEERGPTLVHQSGQPSDKSHVAEPAPEGGGQTEPKAKAENGCSDATQRTTAAHNHEAATQMTWRMRRPTRRP